MRGILAVLPSLSLGLAPRPAPVAPAAPLTAAAPALPAPALALPLAPALAAAAAPAAAEPVRALPALSAAALTAAPLSASAPAEAARGAAAAAFDGALARAPLSAASFGDRRDEKANRLAPLGFEDLTPGDPARPPAPKAPEPRPFLLRHYRVVRFFAAPVVRLFYAVRVEGARGVPPGALIVPNHVSFLDPVLMSFATNRPMRFLMARGIYETPGFEWLFRSLGAIPISPKDPKEVIEESIYRARRALAAGETVVVFPEGQLSKDGRFNPFRRGFERVAAGTGAPVVPAFIDGMWGSAFSRRPGASLRGGLLARLRGRRRVSVRFGPPLPRADTALALEAVTRLSLAAPARP